MKKGIFAMFILVASMAMVACTSSSTVKEGATNEENQALKLLEKRREYYKAQEKAIEDAKKAEEEAKLQAAKTEEENKKAEENARLEAARAQEEAKRIEAEAKKAEEEAKLQAAKAEEEARLEALKILEKKRKTN